jgi:hypothetical protein
VSIFIINLSAATTKATILAGKPLFASFMGSLFRLGPPDAGRHFAAASRQMCREKGGNYGFRPVIGRTSLGVIAINLYKIIMLYGINLSWHTS